MQLPKHVLSFSSCGKLEKTLKKDYRVFPSCWLKPLPTLWEDYERGEVAFYHQTKGNRFLTLEHKVRARILRDGPRGLEFLQESRFFIKSGVPLMQKPSDSTSVSGKINFRDGEDPLERLRIELFQEIGVEDAPVHTFAVRYLAKEQDKPSESKTRNGILKLVTKYGYTWASMPPEYQQEKCREEAYYTDGRKRVLYRVSEFPWVPAPDRILDERRLAA